MSADAKLWTPANVVTVARICGVPLFIVVMLSPWPEWLSFWPDAALWKPWIATLVFIVLAATDGLDGHLARSRNEVTNFGKFCRPPGRQNPHDRCAARTHRAQGPALLAGVHHPVP